ALVEAHKSFLENVLRFRGAAEHAVRNREEMRALGFEGGDRFGDHHAARRRCSPVRPGKERSGPLAQRYAKPRRSNVEACIANRQTSSLKNAPRRPRKAIPVGRSKRSALWMMPSWRPRLTQEPRNPNE